MKNMAGKKVLIIYGGWEGHSPSEVSYFFKEKMEELGFKVIISSDLDVLLDNETINGTDLIIMQWTGDESYKKTIRINYFFRR